MELSDDDRMDMMERLSELEANPDQQSILGKRTMCSRRRDEPAYRKIRHLCALWRRHREQPHLFSQELFQRDLETACKSFLQEGQDQDQQQPGPQAQPQPQRQPQRQPQPQPQQPVTLGAGSGSNANRSSGGGGGTNDPARDRRSNCRRSSRFARVPVVAPRSSGESGGGGGGGGGGGSSSSGSRRGRVVSPGQEEEDNDRSDDGDDDMEHGRNGGGGGGNSGSPGGEAGGGGVIGEGGHDDSGDDGDGGGTMEARVKRVVDAHIKSGFLERHRWKPTKSFACPGNGYWTDKHGISEFRTSTDEDLRVARPAPAPKYIAQNPLCRDMPKNMYDKQRKMYYQCKKVAVSRDGEIFRATDKEIEAALQKESGRKEFLRTMNAGMYVKIIREARRRHRLSEEQDGAALVEPEDEEAEDEEDDEGERDGRRAAESARAGKRVLRVPPGEEEEEEEEEEESDGDGEENDDDDNDTVIEHDQNGGGGSSSSSSSGGDSSRVDVLDISDDDYDEENEAGPDIKKLVDRYEAQGFLHRRRWKSLKTFKCPGEGYWRDKHQIVEFRTSTDADLTVARPAPAPAYIPNNPQSRKFSKARFLKQMTSYHQCKRVAVSSDGKIFRATDKEIEAALNKEPEDKKFLHGMKAGTYVKLIREARRRHRVFWEAEAEEANREEEEDEEEYE